MNWLYGICAVVAGAIIYWLYGTIKAIKDPDVQIAANLRMSINRYRHYQHLYDEYQSFMLEHGANSRASERKYREIFKQINNQNEWRRYQTYREQKALADLKERIAELKNRS